MHLGAFATLLAAILVGFPATGLSSARQKKTQELSPAHYYKKWLNEDVVYIITDEERAVFEKLQTDEEKENFIEQFWARRDLTPESAQNEFHEEHYRRIQYANEQFYSGKAGWQTDRGRIYIRFGPPDSRRIFGPGETYVRPMSEGGGITKTYPFEVWRYRFIERIGPDVEIEFVDPTGTGEFRISLNPNEKDALLRSGGGFTEYEQAGAESRVMRLIREGLATTYTGRTRDLPFERMARQAVLDKAPPLKFDRLREIVNASITYTQLPMDFRYSFIRLGQDSALALLDIEIPHSSLTFEKRSNIHRAEVEIYGRIVDLTGKIQTQFEETLAAEFPESDGAPLSQGRSLLQRQVLLKPGNYKLDAVIKDVRSGGLGTKQVRVTIPDTANTKLWASPVILAHSIEEAGDTGGIADPFLLGSLRVRPQVASSYRKDEVLRAYFQVYNAKLDAAKQVPSMAVRYNLLKDRRLAFSRVDTTGDSIQFVSEQRLVYLFGLPLSSLEPGSYRLLIQITDNTSQETTSTDARFTILQ